MPRGLSDYGLYQEQCAIAGMADLGEAVARLDSINVFDRRGFTVWQDDFEAPVLRWSSVAIAPGVVAVLNTTRAFSGIQCAYLNVPLGIGSQSTLRRTFPFIRSGKAGIEFWVQGFTKAPGWLSLVIGFYDGNIPSNAQLLLDTNTGTVSINHTVAGVGVTTVIATNVYMQTTDSYFLPIKLVVDMDTDMYVRLLVGEREFDISTYSLIILPANTARFIQATFLVLSNAIDDMWAYIDDFILTQNEP